MASFGSGGIFMLCYIPPEIPLDPVLIRNDPELLETHPFFRKIRIKTILDRIKKLLAEQTIEDEKDSDRLKAIQREIQIAQEELLHLEKEQKFIIDEFYNENFERMKKFHRLNLLISVIPTLIAVGLTFFVFISKDRVHKKLIIFRIPAS